MRACAQIEPQHTHRMHRQIERCAVRKHAVTMLADAKMWPNKSWLYKPQRSAHHLSRFFLFRAMSINIEHDVRFSVLWSHTLCVQHTATQFQAWQSGSMKWNFVICSRTRVHAFRDIWKYTRHDISLCCAQHHNNVYKSLSMSVQLCIRIPYTQHNTYIDIELCATHARSALLLYRVMVMCGWGG